MPSSSSLFRLALLALMQQSAVLMVAATTTADHRPVPPPNVSEACLWLYRMCAAVPLVCPEDAEDSERLR